MKPNRLQKEMKALRKNNEILRKENAALRARLGELAPSLPSEVGEASPFHVVSKLGSPMSFSFETLNAPRAPDPPVDSDDAPSVAKMPEVALSREIIDQTKRGTRLKKERKARLRRLDLTFQGSNSKRLSPIPEEEADELDLATASDSGSDLRFFAPSGPNEVREASTLKSPILESQQ